MILSRNPLNVKEYRDNAQAITSLVTDYITDVSLDETDTSRLALAYRCKEVFAINQAIRSARQSLGELPTQTLLQSKHGKRAFASSDCILLTEYNHPLGIRNGMLGTVISISENELEILIEANDGNGPIHWEKINLFTTKQLCTCSKSTVVFSLSLCLRFPSHELEELYATQSNHVV